MTKARYVLSFSLLGRKGGGRGGSYVFKMKGEIGQSQRY